MKKPKSRWPRDYQSRIGDIVIDFRKWHEGLADGIEMAAAFVEEFDSYVNHDWRLSDCIRAKFNKLRKSHMRKNKRKHVIVGVWNK